MIFKSTNSKKILNGYKIFNVKEEKKLYYFSEINGFHVNCLLSKIVKKSKGEKIKKSKIKKLTNKPI